MKTPSPPQLWGVFAAIFAASLLISGCENLAGGAGPIVNFTSATADGGAGLAATTKLTLTFDKDVPGLAAGDIAFNSYSTGAQAGALSKIGTGVYTLDLHNVAQSGSVAISVIKSGFDFTPGSRTLAIHHHSPGASVADVELRSLSANGSPTETTTELTLTFDRSIAELTADNITLDAGDTGATKGVLYKGEGIGVYKLILNNVSASGSVGVSVAMSDYVFTPQSRTLSIHHSSGAAVTNAEFISVTANGSAAATTTLLTLTFGRDIAGLAANNITLDAGATGAQKGALTRTATGVYTLAVSGVTAGGSVTVAVAISGYAFNPQSLQVAINHQGTPAGGSGTEAAFTSVAADGSATETTTKLTLTFDKDIAAFAAGDITLTAGATGAQKGALTKESGTGVYTLAVSGITAGGTVTVAVAKTGYTFAPTSQSVTVHHYEVSAGPPALLSVSANGNATTFTTQLTLTFNQWIDGLAASDLSFFGDEGDETGFISVGPLTQTATRGVYTLAVDRAIAVFIRNVLNLPSSFYPAASGSTTLTGEITVKVNKTGFLAEKTARVYTGLVFSSQQDITSLFARSDAPSENTQATAYDLVPVGWNLEDTGIPGDVSNGRWVNLDLTHCTGTFTADQGVRSGTVASVTLPSTITRIGNNAFNGQTWIGPTLDFLPAGVTEIGDGAFQGTGVRSPVTLPARLKTIGASAFRGLGNLTTITLPNTVESIGDHAFRDTGLTSITLSNTLKSIGDGAFMGTGNLTSITLPASLVNLGTTANHGSGETTANAGNTFGVFQGSGLVSIHIPANVEVLGDSIFRACNSLTTVTFAPGSKLAALPRRAFTGSNGITSLNLPESVKSIGSWAFTEARGITSIDWPHVTTIGASAFSVDLGNRLNTSLVSVNLPEVTSVAGAVFSGQTSLKTARLPKLTAITGRDLFYRCNALELLELGPITGSVQNTAFEACVALQEMILHATTPPTVPTGANSPWGSGTLNANGTTGAVPTSMVLKVPAESVAAYRATAATSWARFTTIEAIP